MTAVAIIPARGGSIRIMHKNIRPFHGKPIIAYSIETALASGLFAAVYVSSEDAEIGAIAAHYGAHWLLRPPELAEIGAPDCGTQAVARHALNTLDETGFYPDYACCIYATAPLMRVDDLRDGYERLRKGHAPYVYSVGPDFIDAGQWYWGRAADFLAGVPLDQAELYVLPADRVCDINTPADWLRAEEMYAAMKESQ